MRVGLLALLLICIASPADAYVRCLSSTGKPLYWNDPHPTIAVATNNNSGIPADQILQMVQSSFGAWQNSGAPISSNLYTSDSPTGNTVAFSSKDGEDLGYGVIALTAVQYYVSNGQIASFQMHFNDNQFLFTNHEGDTGKSIAGRYAVYLRDVATHEAGHSFGLDHSTVERSSLIYSSFSGQFHLGDDDLTAINSIYRSGQNFGSIHGYVEGTNGGIFGAHISAINQSTGRVQAGTLANPDGSFTIGDIPAGDYALMVEPLGTSPSTLSSYYQNINHQFCSWSTFRRSFYSACGSGIATTVNVSAGNSTSIGTISPSCSQMGNPGGIPNTQSQAKTMDSSGGAMFGTYSYAGENHYYKLPGIRGDLTVRALSYTLYSPADVRVDILDSNGNTMSNSESIDNIESPMPGGYTNYDAKASAANLPTGDYFVRVHSNSVSLFYRNYPAGSNLLDSSPHYLLLAEVNGTHGPANITDMSSCISVKNSAQSATLDSSGGVSQSEQTSGGGACGMIHNPHDSGPNGSSGPNGQAAQFLSSSIFLAGIVAALSKLMQKLAEKKS